jgi:hypothetical protein
MPATIGFIPRHAQPFTLEQAMLLEIEVLIAGAFGSCLVRSGLVSLLSLPHSILLVLLLVVWWSLRRTLPNLPASDSSPCAFPFLSSGPFRCSPSDMCKVKQTLTGARSASFPQKSPGSRTHFDISGTRRTS